MQSFVALRSSIAAMLMCSLTHMFPKFGTSNSILLDWFVSTVTAEFFEKNLILQCDIAALL